MLEKAKALVEAYLTEHIGQGASYTLFVCWQAAVLQNFKCLIYATVGLGMYFELTYDGDEKRWYLDTYAKIDNREIPDGVQEQ